MQISQQHIYYAQTKEIFHHQPVCDLVTLNDSSTKNESKEDQDCLLATNQNKSW